MNKAQNKPIGEKVNSTKGKNTMSLNDYVNIPFEKAFDNWQNEFQGNENNLTDTYFNHWLKHNDVNMYNAILPQYTRFIKGEISGKLYDDFVQMQFKLKGITNIPKLDFSKVKIPNTPMTLKNAIKLLSDYKKVKTTKTAKTTKSTKGKK